MGHHIFAILGGFECVSVMMMMMMKTMKTTVTVKPTTTVMILTRMTCYDAIPER